MPYIIPKFNTSNVSSERDRRVYESLGFKYGIISLEKENDFWSDLLVETVEQLNPKDLSDPIKIEYAVYKRVHWCLHNNEINFYVAFKYFWNRLKYYSEGSRSRDDIREVKHVCSEVNRGGFFIESTSISLPSFVAEIPLNLVPKLVNYIFMHHKDRNFSKCDHIARNNFQFIKEFYYPNFKELVFGKKSKKKNVASKKLLQKEYSERARDVNFVTPSIIIGMFGKLDYKQKKEAFRFIHKMQ